MNRYAQQIKYVKCATMIFSLSLFVSEFNCLHSLRGNRKRDFFSVNKIVQFLRLCIDQTAMNDSVIVVLVNHIESIKIVRSLFSSFAVASDAVWRCYLAFQRKSVHYWLMRNLCAYKWWPKNTHVLIHDSVEGNWWKIMRMKWIRTTHANDMAVPLPIDVVYSVGTRALIIDTLFHATMRNVVLNDDYAIYGEKHKSNGANKMYLEISAGGVAVANAPWTYYVLLLLLFIRMDINASRPLCVRRNNCAYGISVILRPPLRRIERSARTKKYIIEFKLTRSLYDFVCPKCVNGVFFSLYFIMSSIGVPFRWYIEGMRVCM